MSSKFYYEYKFFDIDYEVISVFELLGTIILAFIAVMVCSFVMNVVVDFFRSEGLGQINPVRRQPGVSFYGNLSEGRTVILFS